MKKNNDNIKKVFFAGIALFLLMPKKGTAAPGTTTTYYGNGYTPVSGNHGTINESYLGIADNGRNRGIRNNNPGNIKFSTSNAWLGKIPMNLNTDTKITDVSHPRYGQPTFEQASSYAYGVRMLIHLIKNSYISNGHNTLQLIMDRYDPGHSSDYINFVSAKSGKNTFQIILPTDEEAIKKIIQAIARWENGQTGVTEPEVITDFQYQTARNIL